MKVDYESISLIDLIPIAEARDKVKDAEKAKAEGNIPDALLALGIAFDKLRDEARKRDSLGLIPQFYGKHDWDQGLDRVVRQVIDTVNMLILGIHPPKLHRFSVSTPTRNYATSGAMEVLWTHDPNRLGTDDYDFCHQFVIDFALRLASSG